MLKTLAALKQKEENYALEKKREPMDPYKEIPYGVDVGTRMEHLKARRRLFNTKAGGAVAACGSKLSNTASRIIIERRGIPEAHDGVGVEKKEIKALNPWTIATLIKTRLSKMNQNLHEKEHNVEEETKETGENVEGENPEGNEEENPEDVNAAVPAKTSPWKRLTF